MESFNELMMRRRSSRKFTAEPIAPDQVQELLKAALVAPTSKNAHSWQFVAVEEIARCWADWLLAERWVAPSSAGARWLWWSWAT